MVHYIMKGVIWSHTFHPIEADCFNPFTIKQFQDTLKLLYPRSEEGGILFYTCVPVCLSGILSVFVRKKISLAFLSATIHCLWRAIRSDIFLYGSEVNFLLNDVLYYFLRNFKQFFLRDFSKTIIAYAFNFITFFV